MGRDAGIAPILQLLHTKLVKLGKLPETLDKDILLLQFKLVKVVGKAGRLAKLLPLQFKVVRAVKPLIPVRLAIFSPATLRLVSDWAGESKLCPASMQLGHWLAIAAAKFAFGMFCAKSAA